MTLESIRRKLNHSIKILDHVTFDVDGVGSSVEDSLVYMLETGQTTCIRQLTVKFRLQAGITRSNIVKRIQMFRNTLITLYTVGFRSFAVEDNIENGIKFSQALAFSRKTITLKVNYVNMRLGLCKTAL
ncbi:unnamed protein product [Clavelina lepadiformis]|uniref:Uncharacterized protein n=1 Tax=Clavelina lepadiformis TaxID=159417 RepID=A0ABP0GDZ8_CLALP